MRHLIRRVRAGFGISAPKVAVRTHLAWYWRWLGIGALAAMGLALALWMYDAGRRFAGFDQGEIEQELRALKQAAHSREDELRRLRAIADASESRLKIEQAAGSQLAAQVKSLEGENSRLKEDLAFFENLFPTSDRLSIQHLRVEPDVLPGEYRYRLLILQGGKRERLFQGSLQFVVSVQQDNRNDMIVLPRRNEAAAPGFTLSFRHFYRGEGTFRVPSAAKVKSVQVRVLENGSNQARATQSVNLS